MVSGRQPSRQTIYEVAPSQSLLGWLLHTGVRSADRMYVEPLRCAFQAPAQHV